MPRKNKKISVVGSHILAGLKRSGMRQNELAQKIGISASSLNMMISGASALPLRRFYQIAAILNLTQDEINQVNEYYRNKLCLSPDQSKHIFVSPTDLHDKLLETALKGDKFAQTIAGEPDADFIKARIDEIYAQLDRAERAELLAAAERILEKRPNNKK